MACPHGFSRCVVIGKAASSRRTPKKSKATASLQHAAPLQRRVVGVVGGVVLEVAGGLDYGEVVAGAGYEL